MFENTG